MARKIIDRVKVQELFDKGVRVIDIAAQLGCTKGAVSKILKEMGHEVVKAAVSAAPKYEQRRDQATQHLLYLAEKARFELDWIESTVPPANDVEYREWQNQKLKFAAEMRKLISAMADIGYKLFQVEEVNEIIRIIDEEIGCESQECQKRIRERIQRRRNIRFPTIVA
jgi:predicted transcriptional regulator